jgi:transposase
VRELIRVASASVLYLPPYSPDMNPIELCWSKLKGLLREFGARTATPSTPPLHDAAGWFRHCGYQAG